MRGNEKKPWEMTPEELKERNEKTLGRNQVAENIVDDILNKQINGQKLTRKEQAILRKAVQLAWDGPGGLPKTGKDNPNKNSDATYEGNTNED